LAYADDDGIFGAMRAVSSQRNLILGLVFWLGLGHDVRGQGVEDLPDQLQAVVAVYATEYRAPTSPPPATVNARVLPAASPVAAAIARVETVVVAPLRAEPVLVKAVRETATIQIALDRRGFGIGLIDGQSGRKTQQALLDFRYITTNAVPEAEARRQLLDDPAPAFVWYEVTAGDLAQVGPRAADWEEAAQLPAMACHSLIEGLSEKFHATDGFLRRLNPSVTNWGGGLVGRRLCVPNVRTEAVKFDVKQIVVDTECFRLRGYDAKGRMVCSFPCSIARERAKVPVGELRVANVAPHPNYTFDPANFPESARAQQIGRKLILPPGPRNPVGVYWISLSQPGYGMHGTPHPETIGNMESHGCFRLCNWDAHTLGQGMFLGLPVRLDIPPVIFKK
jgi:lipoprotein-anchoring transpeptidase ErfK/SrfK